MYGHGQEWITSVDHPSSRHSGINDGDPFHFSQGGDDVPANLFPGPLQGVEDLYEPFDNGPQAMFNPVPQSFEALRVGLHFSIPPETGQNSHIAESTFIDVPQETQGEYLPVGAFDMPLASTFQTTAGQSLHQDQNWNMSQSGAGPAAGDFEGSLFVSNNTIDFNIAPNVMPVDSSEAQPLILPDGYTDGSTDALRGINFTIIVLISVWVLFRLFVWIFVSYTRGSEYHGPRRPVCRSAEKGAAASL
ncbi:hypothetical protein CERSUDRAFT_90129 [Gelatoporia subvermispora B]|uniref:Uncharacterized protein n=1 Tax=Ceriporiopsis subvermispora (strain B) TaxID=914234 RepID=M2RRP4_CERS8|nr:hypothetical protein CERSUDRAFT_90129 [Gelatoporia subvermispora B]